MGRPNYCDGFMRNAIEYIANRLNRVMQDEDWLGGQTSWHELIRLIFVSA